MSVLCPTYCICLYFGLLTVSVFILAYLLYLPVLWPTYCICLYFGLPTVSALLWPTYCICLYFGLLTVSVCTLAYLLSLSVLWPTYCICTLSYLLYLSVLGLDLLASDRITLDVVVLSCNDQTTKLPEWTLPTHGKQRSVKVRVILT